MIRKTSASGVLNEARTWPDWRTADPEKTIEHVKSEVRHVVEVGFGSAFALASCTCGWRGELFSNRTVALAEGAEHEARYAKPATCETCGEPATHHDYDQHKDFCEKHVEQPGFTMSLGAAK